MTQTASWPLKKKEKFTEFNPTFIWSVLNKAGLLMMNIYSLIIRNQQGGGCNIFPGG